MAPFPRSLDSLLFAKRHRSRLNRGVLLGGGESTDYGVSVVGGMTRDEHNSAGGDGSKSKDLICPKCFYGFEASPGAYYTCPSATCGHRFKGRSETLIQAYSTEGRLANPEIVVMSGELSGEVYPLPVGTIVLGRAEDCDIVFSNLGISRHHARITVSDAGGVVLEDLGSAQGTYLNGRPVTRAPLRIGAEIVIAGVLIRYRVRFEARGDPAALEEAMGQEEAFGKDDRRFPVRYEGREQDRIVLRGDRLTIGRQEDRDVFIDHPLVSRRHAVLVREGASWLIVDAGSRNGTFINGRPIIQCVAAEGDLVQFGTVRFRYDGRALVRQRFRHKGRLEARGLGVRTASGSVILDEIDFVITPQELVGIIGASGSGKTTLLNALSGYRQATEGQVLLGEYDLYEGYETFKTGMGYVPQDDIIHTELTPVEALRYAGRLRLPRDTSAAELERLVDQTLATLGLEERRELRIRDLSGGQRKRVNLGVELLNQASLIFMDEPTSGLDPGTEGRMMRLFRKLADQERTLIVTTHVMENIEVFDKVAVLHHGRLVFFGTPAAMRKHFAVARATELYDVLEQQPIAHWLERWRVSDQRQPGGTSAPKPMPHNQNRRSDPRGTPPTYPLHQTRVLAERYARTLSGDRRNMALMVFQPVAIFPVICGVFNHAGTILFLSSLAMFWLGITNSAREIVRERRIYLRERMVVVNVGPYLLSKFVVLALVSGAQTAFALMVVLYFQGLPGSAVLYGACLLAAIMSGLWLGMLISAVSDTSEQATAVLPMILIPQIVFGGFILEIERMNLPSRVVSNIITTRWTYEGLRYTFQERYFDIIARNLLVVAGLTLLAGALAWAWMSWRRRVGA